MLALSQVFDRTNAKKAAKMRISTVSCCWELITHVHTAIYHLSATYAIRFIHLDCEWGHINGKFMRRSTSVWTVRRFSIRGLKQFSSGWMFQNLQVLTFFLTVPVSKSTSKLPTTRNGIRVRSVIARSIGSISWTNIWRSTRMLPRETSRWRWRIPSRWKRWRLSRESMRTRKCQAKHKFVLGTHHQCMQVCWTYKTYRIITHTLSYSKYINRYKHIVAVFCNWMAQLEEFLGKRSCQMQEDSK